MSTTLQFDFRKTGVARRREGSPARLLLLGDFGGRAHRGLAEAASLAARPAPAVDLDNLDEVFRRFAPRVTAASEDGTAVSLTPQCLDDLHPDRLVEAHAPLAGLLGLRRRLLDPARFEAAAAELNAALGRPVAPGGGAGAAAGAAPPPPEDVYATLDRLLGSSPVGAAASSASRAASTVNTLLRRIVTERDLAPELRFQPQYLAAVEEPASVQLRALLHLPAFQSLEAAWRGVQLLVSRLDLDEELQLHLLDVTLDELRADAAQAGGDVSRSALGRRLRQLAAEAADAGATWLAVGGLFSFGAGDLEVLAAVGAAAQAADMTFIAGADATIAGTFPDSAEWLPPAAVDPGRWRALRGSGVAASIGLVAPRLLLRLPYGHATDEIDSFPFEELAGSVPAPGELLWGDGALAALLVTGRASRERGGELDIDELPALNYSEDGERKLQPCTEWLLGERVGTQLFEHGVMPLLGSRHRNAVRLAGWRTLVAS